MNKNDPEASEMFEPFEKLVEIEILGRKRHVPENNSLLRCMQYLSMETISYGDFCWNGECINCQMWIENGEKEKPVMACRTLVKQDMKIVRMSREIQLIEAGFE